MGQLQLDRADGLTRIASPVEHCLEDPICHKSGLQGSAF